LDKRIEQFQRNTRLQCASGCGKCCLKPDIEASVLEFLPFAYHFYHENDFETVMKFVEAPESRICKLFKPLVIESEKGFCGNYDYRGLICRLFGYSAMRDKANKPTMFTCSIIKSAPEYDEALVKLAKGLKVPYTADYYKRLSQIDYGLANEMLPINAAIRRAIQEVVHYYTYRPEIKPGKLQRAG
jgi:hypothetical protein